MVNKVILLGRLGTDVELKSANNGTEIANFSLATSEKFTNKNGERVENTEWHRIVCFGKTASLCCQYLSKGRQVFLEGKIQTRSWDDKDGNKRWTTEIVANIVKFIGGQAQDDKSNADKAQSMAENVFNTDDVPF